MAAVCANKRGCPEVTFPSGGKIARDRRLLSSARCKRRIFVQQSCADEMKATENALHVVTFAGICANRSQQVLSDPDSRANRYEGAVQSSRVGPLEQLRETIEHGFDSRTPTRIERLQIMGTARFVAQIDY